MYIAPDHYQSCKYLIYVQDSKPSLAWIQWELFCSNKSQTKQFLCPVYGISPFGFAMLAIGSLTGRRQACWASASRHNHYLHNDFYVFWMATWLSQGPGGPDLSILERKSWPPINSSIDIGAKLLALKISFVRLTCLFSFAKACIACPISCMVCPHFGKQYFKVYVTRLNVLSSI